MKAIILAAGIGKRLRKLTKEPKCLLKVNGLPLIYRYILFLKGCGVKEIVIVVGYKKERIIREINKFRSLVKIKIINNPEFSKGSIASLWRARGQLGQETLIMDGDVYFESDFIKKVFASRKKNFFLIDRKIKFDPEAVIVGFKRGRAVALARGLRGKFQLRGEWAGVLKLSARCSRNLKELLKNRVSAGEETTGYEFIIPDLFKDNNISYALTDGLKWIEIDFPEDLKKAQKFSSVCIP